MKINNKILSAVVGFGAIAGAVSSVAIAQDVHAAEGTVTVSSYEELHEIFRELYLNDEDDNYTITLSNDIEQGDETYNLAICTDDTITLDLNSYTLNFSSHGDGEIRNQGTLNIEGNGLITSTTDTSEYAIIRNQGTLNLVSGSVISNFAPDQEDYSSIGAIYNRGTMTVHDGFVIGATGEGSAGVVNYYGGTATFGTTVGSEADQVVVYGAETGVLVLSGTAIFNNGSYTGELEGIRVTNDSEDMTAVETNVTINYATMAGTDSEDGLSFYAGVDDTKRMNWDMGDVTIIFRDGKFADSSFYGIVDSRDSESSWTLQADEDVFDVAVRTGTDYFIYKIYNREIDFYEQGENIITDTEFGPGTAALHFNQSFTADRKAYLVVNFLSTDEKAGLALTTGGELLEAIDFTVLDRNDDEIAISDTSMKMEVLLSEEQYNTIKNYDDCYVVYFDENGNETERIAGELKLVDDGEGTKYGILSFALTHLSTYGIVGVNDLVVPNTGDFTEASGGAAAEIGMTVSAMLGR